MAPSPQLLAGISYIRFRTDFKHPPSPHRSSPVSSLPLHTHRSCPPSHALLPSWRGFPDIPQGEGKTGEAHLCTSIPTTPFIRTKTARIGQWFRLLLSHHIVDEEDTRVRIPVRAHLFAFLAESYSREVGGDIRHSFDGCLGHRGGRVGLDRLQHLTNGADLASHLASHPQQQPTSVWNNSVFLRSSDDIYRPYPVPGQPSVRESVYAHSLPHRRHSSHPMFPFAPCPSSTFRSRMSGCTQTNDPLPANTVPFLLLSISL